MCSKETPKLASPPLTDNTTKPVNGTASTSQASQPTLGPIPEGDEYSSMTDEEVGIESVIFALVGVNVVGFAVVLAGMLALISRPKHRQHRRCEADVCSA